MLVLPLSGFGQYRDATPGSETGKYLRSTPTLGLNPVRGLLDPSRMHMSNSLQMGYVNGGGVSVSRGLYMNNLTYDISRPLSVTTHLGYQFQPSGPAEWNPANNGQQFVGGADLNWQPSDHALFRLSVYRGMYPDPYPSPFGYGWNPYPYGYNSYYRGHP